ncbi:MAG: glycosyltransferase family A protein [bacterium]|nr:glycosyltransferase family A protein [bacterium]
MQLISIIIPVYNHLSDLMKSLHSISNQTYQGIEVIVVDDGSDVEVSGKMDSKDFDFDLFIYRQENMGAPSARNKGFEMSKGEFVIFWDADVVATPEMLQKMHNVLTIHPEASYVYCDFYYGRKKMPAQKFDGDKLRQNNYIMTTSLIHRDDFPYFDEKLKRFQDWDLWLTMLEKNKIGIYIPEFLFFVMPHKNGISGWLPSIAYKKPWSWLPGIKKKVKDYEIAKQIVLKKHSLIP